MPSDQIELSASPADGAAVPIIGSTEDNSNVYNDNNAPPSAVEAIPDGGYGWPVVSACSVITFMINGWSGTWGVNQAALLNAFPDNLSVGSLPFAGSMNFSLSVGMSIIGVRIALLIGARNSMLIGVLLMRCCSLFYNFTLDNFAGLFITAGFFRGVGCGLAYTTGSTLPVQWFDRRLGTANGIVKLENGVGATTTALYIQALISRFGIAWAVRVFGFISLAAGLRAALLIKGRGLSYRSVFIDWSLFKEATSCCLFFAGAVATFALYVPTFFLPLFAHSIRLSPSLGVAGLLAAYNAFTMVGHLGSGF